VKRACLWLFLLTIAVVWPAACRLRPSFEGHATNWSQSPKMNEAPPQDPLETLLAAGVQFRAAPVSSRSTAKGLRCQIPDGVLVLKGATGVRYSKAPHVNANFAVRLTAFERMVQEESQKWFGVPVKRIEQLGTYVCRNVAGAGGTLSEHALGNAIDVSGFVLTSGVRIKVKRDFAHAGTSIETPAQAFLAALVARLRDERTFGVILTPDWDAKHHDHLHLDGSRRFMFWPMLSWSS